MALAQRKTTLHQTERGRDPARSSSSTRTASDAASSAKWLSRRSVRRATTCPEDAIFKTSRCGKRRRRRAQLRFEAEWYVLFFHPLLWASCVAFNCHLPVSTFSYAAAFNAWCISSLYSYTKIYKKQLLGSLWAFAAEVRIVQLWHRSI